MHERIVAAIDGAELALAGDAALEMLLHLFRRGRVRGAARGPDSRGENEQGNERFQVLTVRASPDIARAAILHCREAELEG